MWSKAGTRGRGVGLGGTGVALGAADELAVGVSVEGGVAEACAMVGAASVGARMVGVAKAQAAVIKAARQVTSKPWICRKSYTRFPLTRTTGTSITVGRPGMVSSTAKRTTSPCNRSVDS